MLSRLSRVNSSRKCGLVGLGYRRLIATETTKGDDGYRLTCGLEIHAQLLTKHKLFSNSPTSFHATPNSKVSYFDAALPGTQPVFNWNALGLGIKAAVALDCSVEGKISFDRKHYFYGDQPSGYQITQYYEPFAKNGKLGLFKRDGLKEDVIVRIKQIQIEQDTGKSTYIEEEGEMNKAKIDLNRTNTGLIELVTEPDLPTPESAGIFVKKLQSLLRHLKVCSGELESGAMRVDVNVSVNGGQRCEIKNLFSTSAVVHAIKAEFERQKIDIKNGKKIQSETRGWDGKNTWKLRGKEDTVDYRYMPDPELMPISVSREIVESIRKTMPKLPDEIFQELLKKPFSVPLVDARTIMSIPKLVDYYYEVYNNFIQKGGKNANQISNWIVHRLLGEINQNDKEFSAGLIPSEFLSDLIINVENKKITKTSGHLILKHVIINGISNYKDLSIDNIIEEFDLGKAEDENINESLKAICKEIIDKNPDVIKRIQSNPKSIKFLVGQVMRESQGRVEANLVEQILKSLL